MVVSSNYQPIPQTTQHVINIPSTRITTQQTHVITVNPTVDAQQQEIIDQLRRQNQLLEEQNKKLQEQSSLLQNLIDIWNKFLRALGMQK